MMLIGEGICDVIWTPHNLRSNQSKSKFLRKTDEVQFNNPMDKFSDSLHKILVSNKKQADKSEQESAGMQGFKVQRLMRGEAMTIRSLSAYDYLIPSQLKIVAASRSVKVFEFHRSKLSYLPENIKVQ